VPLLPLLPLFGLPLPLLLLLLLPLPTGLTTLLLPLT
jgi:hypothetical protein